jgi:putative phosphoribosyl transferase
MKTHEISIPVGAVQLTGDLTLIPGALGLVLFAHGSGSSRKSPRNQFVARALQNQNISTLLFDLLTRREEELDEYSGEFRFNIPLLAQRLVGATRWLMEQPETRDMRMGYFGSSTGAAAALIGAAELGERIGAVVSRGGRPDLAMENLPNVKSPTLLIVGGSDTPVIGMNQKALAALRCKKSLVLVPRATHLFEEAGALEKVCEVAARWFRDEFREDDHG